jgi:hypothetical protein
MPCLLALLAYFFPRFAIIMLVIFSDYVGRAYNTFLWPLLGFIFFPYTTLAYAFAINSNGSVRGIYLVLVVIAVLLDLGTTGGAEASRRKQMTPRG